MMMVTIVIIIAMMTIIKLWWQKIRHYNNRNKNQQNSCLERTCCCSKTTDIDKLLLLLLLLPLLVLLLLLLLLLLLMLLLLLRLAALNQSSQQHGTLQHLIPPARQHDKRMNTVTTVLRFQMGARTRAEAACCWSSLDLKQVVTNRPALQEIPLCTLQTHGTMRCHEPHVTDLLGLLSREAMGCGAAAAWWTTGSARSRRLRGWGLGVKRGSMNPKPQTKHTDKPNKNQSRTW
jgi:hypothetical protein